MTKTEENNDYEFSNTYERSSENFKKHPTTHGSRNQVTKLEENMLFETPAGDIFGLNFASARCFKNRVLSTGLFVPFFP